MLILYFGYECFSNTVVCVFVMNFARRKNEGLLGNWNEKLTKNGKWWLYLKTEECITMSTESNTAFEYKPKVSFYKIANEPRHFRGFENTIVWCECLDVYCMQPAASMSGTLISFFSVKAEEQPTATFPDEHNY